MPVCLIYQKRVEAILPQVVNMVHVSERVMGVCGGVGCKVCYPDTIHIDQLQQAGKHAPNLENGSATGDSICLYTPSHSEKDRVFVYLDQIRETLAQPCRERLLA